MLDGGVGLLSSHVVEELNHCSGVRWVRWVLRGTVDIQECRRGCVDYLSRQLVLKWHSPNGGGELATERTASHLMVLEGVAA